MKTIKFTVLNLILLVSSFFTTALGDNRIILYLKHAPEEVIQESIAEAKRQNLFEHLDEKTPGMVNHKIMKGALREYFAPKLSGFFAIYGGYMDISNKDGLIMFPLRHATPKIYVAIAPTVELVKVQGETISHREFLLNEESKLYSFERKVDAKKNAYWQVTAAQLPADRKVNPITLVLFAKASNIAIFEGNFLAAESSHLILPDIAVLGNLDQEKILLQALDLRRYFETITLDKKKVSDNTVQKMVTNL